VLAPDVSFLLNSRKQGFLVGVVFPLLFGCQAWSSGFLRKGDVFRLTL